jgi:hypothetical protein
MNDLEELAWGGWRRCEADEDPEKGRGSISCAFTLKTIEEVAGEEGYEIEDVGVRQEGKWV